MADLFNSAFDKNKNREPLHPVIQMRYGVAAGKKVETANSFVMTIPPEHLVEFTYTCRKGGSDLLTITFIDATYGDIEAELFNMEKRNETLLVRWGYPGNGLEQADWHRFEIMNISPTITNAGIRLSITGSSFGTKFAVIAEPTVYVGKISDVAQKIAEEMGYSKQEIFIEETDDEENATRKTPWATGNMTRVDMMNYLRQSARSKSNPQEVYKFKLSSLGSFHFHTDLFKKDKQKIFGNPQPQKNPTSSANKKKTYRKFNVLFGIPTGVMEFTPQYHTGTVGLFAKQCVGATVDPRTKQFQQRTIDRNSLGMSTDHDPKGARTSQGPIVDPKSEKDSSALAVKQRRKSNSFVTEVTKNVGIGGRCAGKTTQPHTSAEQAFAKIENAWKALQHSIGSATLQLVGLPEYVNFHADEVWIDIAVVLPQTALNVQQNFRSSNTNSGSTVAAGSDARGGLHWSSGRYRINSIVHSVTTGYIISAELVRSTHLEGPTDAKTKTPQKKAPKTVTIPTRAEQAVDLISRPENTNVVTGSADTDF